jgi:hypothetical protein
MEQREIVDIPNPFRFGTMIDGNEFCNRTNEIKTIKQYIFDRYSFWLFSPRRYGKSSLIRRVFSEIKKTKTIYIDLYNVKSADDFARKYSKVIARELFDWKKEVKEISKRIAGYLSGLHPVITINSEGVPSLTLEKWAIDDKADLEQILEFPEKFAKDNKISVCVAFDEFQEIERIDPFIINLMRTSFQNHKHVCYAFLGSKQTLMESIFTNINSPFYEFALKMTLETIPFDEFHKFIKDKFKKSGMSISDERINNILKKSNGHPHFTQYFASVVFDLMRSGEDSDDEELFVEKWMMKIIYSQGIVLQNIYDQLKSSQRLVLSALAFEQDGKGLYSEEIRKKYNLPVSSSLTITLNGLMKKNLIYKSKSGYKIDNPVFKEWLIKLNNNELT